MASALSRMAASAAGSGVRDSRTHEPSPDPVGMLGGLNLYAYVENDPVLFNDPQGLWPGWLDRAVDSTASWVSRKAKAVYRGAKTAVSTVASGIKDAAGWTYDNVLAPTGRFLKYTGNQLMHFGIGFGKGLWNCAKGMST